MRNLLTFTTIAFILLHGISYAQINESFSDGNFTTNPVWSGDVGSFEIIAPPASGDGSINAAFYPDGQLLRSKPNHEDAVLTTASSRAYGEWLFSIADGKNWSISGSNDFYVILMSDTNDPALLKNGSMNFNGYFLRFDGGNNDSFVLYKQTATTSEAIILTGFPEGTDGNSSTPYSIKVTRETNGAWKIFIEEGLYINAKILRGSGVDNDITTSNYFGFATNISNQGDARLAYIDQIITRDIIEDTNPPFIENLIVSSTKSIDLYFNEYTDSLSANTTSNYVLNQSINPTNTQYLDEQNSQIRLFFAQPLTGGQITSLYVQGVEDIETNTTDTTITFTTPEILGQNIHESFTDGNFTENPTWSGNTESFEIVNPDTTVGSGSFNPDYPTDGSMLRSKMNQENKVLTFQTICSYGQWNFTIADGKGWSISGNNDYYIILNASTNDPALLDPDNKNFYGYYLRYDGGSNDRFVLYKQTGTESTAIITTNFPEETDGNTSIPYSFKITRTENEGWHLFIDEGVLCSAFTLRGTSSDNEIQTGAYFGIATNIGSPSKARVVYLDNIYVGEIIADTIPPALSSYTIVNQSRIELIFTEPIDTTLLSPTNFTTINTGSPSQIKPELYGKKLLLSFDSNFPIRENETLTITGVQDLNNNSIADTSITFAYFIPEQGDIVINEVFFDNYPQVALPEYDYLELYNRSAFDINLENWSITIGNDTRALPNYLLNASDYLIVTSSGAVETYALYANAIDVITTTMLSNAGKNVIIKDSTGNIIHQITYSPEWYHDAEKENGGWSIEQIDPDTWCAQSNNWRASICGLGGTPGEINSVDSNNQDLEPPFIINLAIVDTSNIILELSEICPPEQINNTNIQILPNQGAVTFTQSENNSRQWVISINTIFDERKPISLTISNLSDYCGNTINDTTITTYRVPSHFQQIIFNEIMANPSENQSFAYEYLELFNRDTLPICINNWELSVAGKSWTLPFATIPANGYLLVLPKSMLHHNQQSNSIYLFDDSDLNNNGALLKLTDVNNNTITWTEYENNWHTNNLADLGGYALERIDPNHFCGGNENWQTSSSVLHGTPGTENAANGTTIDEIAPQALLYALPEDSSIHILFDSPMWPNTTSGTIATTTLQFDSIFIPHPQGNKLIVKLKEPLEYLSPYNIQITGFKDCNDNAMENAQFHFEKPTHPEPGDVVINEILFNPPTNCDDFVELLNISDKYLAFDLMLTAKLDDYGELDNFKTITDQRFVLPPDTPYILTNNYNCLKENYNPVYKNRTIITKLPSLANDAGNIAITNYEGIIIDKIQYTEDMHHSLLNDPNGVSLERISPYAPSDNPSNWYSAASDVGFATPTRQNSQYNAKAITENNISLEEETVSPNGDGYQDFLKINYQFAQGNNILTIRILDHKGVPIRNILDHETVSTEGFVTWDATNNNGHRMPMGIYIILSEWFDNNGNQHANKQTCVVAGELKH